MVAESRQQPSMVGDADQGSGRRSGLLRCFNVCRGRRRHFHPVLAGQVDRWTGSGGLGAGPHQLDSEASFAFEDGGGWSFRQALGAGHRWRPVRSGHC